ncbi:hypothetical protein AWM70_07310 [Paenibacillus yonginensis]|uniref:Uncharacterized protein n=1 Tax=Paenibacillus yonginensis TaxID=1462996 RepID=A0A1B1MZ19_9BACL|nr:hypothetical protein AWM70_07310 [Paenibacillus yonginensis]
MTSSILEVFGFGHLKTSPSWGEVPFLCPKILTAQGLRLLQNAHLKNGFKEEGRARQKIYKKGRYWDVIRMSILKSEYEQV